jgi:aspartate/methionine/tyrosine aminotransferase
MIPIIPSNTTNSAILATGKQLANAIKETGKEYLLLNRGVNSVVNIRLDEVIQQIDFNSNDIQVYPGSNGKAELRNAINLEYFNNRANSNQILITGGGISGLDICFQNLAVGEVVLPKFFWGTYAQLSRLRELPFSCYPDYDYLMSQAKNLKGKAVIICDPGNPLGEKYDDAKLLQVIDNLNSNGVVVLFDSPYRRLFYDQSDTFYQQLMKLEHVIIIESFSKSLGLSGQRIGFLYSNSDAFNAEAQLRLTYATNGVNSFAQVLVTNLLSTASGKKAVAEFKKTTTTHIAKNIQFLTENGLLANEYYRNSVPLGIFAVVNRSPEELFKQRIGSVGLDYFVKDSFAGIEKLSRVLVSYPHEKFVSFFETLL